MTPQREVNDFNITRTSFIYDFLEVHLLGAGALGRLFGGQILRWMTFERDHHK